MAAVDVDPLRDVTPPPASRGRRERRRLGRGAVLVIAALYFLGPVAAAFWFTVDSGHGVDLHAYTSIPTTPGFGAAVLMSLEIAVLTVVISLALMVPTALLIHLRFRRARGAVELLCLLPLVVPPIVLVVGVGKIIAWANTSDTTTAPFQITNQLLNSHPPLILPLTYVVLALPFTFRSLDAGLRTSGITTLVEAARNLGAGWVTILWRVALPTLRTSVLNAAFLIFALAFGEFTVASVLQIQTFTVWLLQFGSSDGQLSVALALLSLLLTWLLLIVITVVAGRAPESSRKESA
jgi:putative spermidine/putrescine transport system permease protein